MFLESKTGIYRPEKSNCTKLKSVSVSCQQLDAIPSGNFTMSTDGLVTIANYSCADGYTMEGTAVLTCGTDGAWSSTPPTCGQLQVSG